MTYLTRHGQWSEKAREVEILHRNRLSSAGESESALEQATRLSERGASSNDPLRGVNFYPLASTSVHFTFEGYHCWATRSRSLVGDSSFEESLALSFLTFSPNTMRRFIAHVKTAYDSYERGKVQIYTMDRYGYWSRSRSILRRLQDSLHLPVGVKENLLQDASQFLTEENRRFYADRGLPLRRGFLFHGPPGGGKTSMAHVLASELQLPIYQMTLSGTALDDSKFSELMASVPAGSVVIIEDIDAAFTKRSDGSPPSTADGQHGRLSSRLGTDSPITSKTSSNVSFSSLLNAIDGIGASESRILIMTTNHKEALDEALLRPGRVDLQVEFNNADKEQAKGLFLRWFTQSGPSSKVKAEKPQEGDEERMESEKAEEKTAEVSIAQAADRFASLVPEGVFSVAALQGYLLTCSGRTPQQAAEGVSAWVRQQQQQS